MNRQLPAAVLAAMTTAARWLLRVAGHALAAPAPACTDRSDALRRAAQAVNAAGANGWPRAFTGAVRIGDRWMCSLQDLDSVYLVEVSCHTGTARILVVACKTASGYLDPAPATPAHDPGRAGHCLPRARRGGHGWLLHRRPATPCRARAHPAAADLQRCSPSPRRPGTFR